MALAEDMAKIRELLENNNVNKKGKIKEKKFKFPSRAKVSKANRKKNYVTTIILNENGSVDFKKYQITDQTIMHDTIPRLATAGYINYDAKGNPILILPNWSVEPLSFNSKLHVQQTLEDGSNVTGYKLLMNKMRLETVQTKKPMAGWIKWVIGLGFAGIIIYAIMTTGAK